jgi:hypothetical protein
MGKKVPTGAAFGRKGTKRMCQMGATHWTGLPGGWHLLARLGYKTPISRIALNNVLGLHS